MNSETMAYLLDSLNTDVDYRPTMAGGNTFIDRVPASPDSCVSVIAFGGDTDKAVGEGIAVWQIRVRGEADDPVGPRSLITSIADDLFALPVPVSVATNSPGAARVVLFNVGVPYMLGWDDLDRCEWALRVEVRFSLS